jgi:hypothetical protein
LSDIAVIAICIVDLSIFRGLPPLRPRALAAASPARVLSAIRGNLQEGAEIYAKNKMSIIQ